MNAKGGGDKVIVGVLLILLGGFLFTVNPIVGGIILGFGCVVKHVGS